MSDQCPYCSFAAIDLHLMAICPRCDKWLEGRPAPIMVDIKLTSMPAAAAGYRADEHRVPVIRRMPNPHPPPPVFMYDPGNQGSAEDYGLEFRPISYKRHRIETPLGPRDLYVRDSELPVLLGMVSLASEELQAIARKAVRHYRDTGEEPA